MRGAIAKPLILLVEDSEDDAFFFQRSLKKVGFAGTCMRAENGEAAINFLERARTNGGLPELIFLDLKMPRVNGFEFLMWLGQQTFEPPLHVVILSGSDHPADVELSRELGAREFLVKPVSADVLTAALATLSIASPLAKAAA